MKTYTLADGKYVIIKDDQGLITAKRHGEDWPGFSSIQYSNVFSAALNYIDDLEDVLQSKRDLTRDLDVALNGENGAAKQGALCDLVSQAAAYADKFGPAFAPRASAGDVVILQLNRDVASHQWYEFLDHVSKMNQEFKAKGNGVQFMALGPHFNVHIARGMARIEELGGSRTYETPYGNVEIADDER
jgi:hypothetical protein